MSEDRGFELRINVERERLLLPLLLDFLSPVNGFLPAFASVPNEKEIKN